VIYVLKRPQEVSYESLSVEDWLDVESGEVSEIVRVICDGLDACDENSAAKAAEVAMKEKAHKIDEDDFEALDRLARSLTPEQMRPLSSTMRRRWQAAKRGRPRKAPGTKAVPTMITVEPGLLRRIDLVARSQGVSRSQFLADAARRQLRLAS
jgi:hypothetical protein